MASVSDRVIPVMLIGDILLGVFALFVSALGFTFLCHMFFIGVPYVPTSRKIAEHMVNCAMLQGHERVYDLGAGDGAILRVAKRKHPGIHATGVELLPTVWFIGKMRMILFGPRFDLRLSSMFNCSVRDADVIFLYLFPHVMERLAKKFDVELKPGTRVVSHGFSFPGRTPEQTFRVPAYRRTKFIHLYRW